MSTTFHCPESLPRTTSHPCHPDETIGYGHQLTISLNYSESACDGKQLGVDPPFAICFRPVLQFGLLPYPGLGNNMGPGGRWLTSRS